MIDAFILNILIFMGIYVTLALSLNLAMGYTGLLNLGHAAFYGIGAYTSALLALAYGVPFWFGILAGGLMAALFGLLMAPTSKLKGDYLALATLGLVIIVENIFRNSEFTRGPLGLAGIPKPELFGFVFKDLYSYFGLVMALAIATYIIIKLLVESPFGRVLKAVRDDEMAVASLGKNPSKYKTIALVLSAFFAGVAGSLFAHYITFIDPSSFTITESILVVSMIIVGGLASLRGSVAGAVILVLIPEILRFLPIPSHMIGALRMMIYAALLVIIILKRPQGIFGEKSLEVRNA